MALLLTFSIILCLSVVAVYHQVAAFDFVTLDDPGYVVDNPMVLSGLSFDNVRWAFSTVEMSNWHPLTWLSYMIDTALFGAAPGKQHVTNAVLHTLAAIVLLITLVAATSQPWPSMFVAMLFAIHPMHVESVAWISERKDVLSGLFWLLATLTYVYYTRAPSWKRYAGVSVLFLCALMSKPMAITWPFALLLLDFWPLARFGSATSGAGLASSLSCESKPSHIAWRLLREKLPWIAMSVAIGLLTVLAQGGAVKSPPLTDRIGNAVISDLVYCYKLFVPLNLGVFYPYPNSLSGIGIGGALVVLCLVTFVAIRCSRRAPYLPVGWFWFLGTLVPVIGLLQVGLQARADRYTYIPYIGLFIIVAWGGRDLIQRLSRFRASLAAGAIAFVFWLGVLATLQVGVWRNSVSLWRHTIAVTTDNSFAHHHLGMFFSKRGNIDLALEHHAKAAAISPANADVRNGLGIAYVRRGKIAEAEREFRIAVALDPDHEHAIRNLQALRSESDGLLNP